MLLQDAAIVTLASAADNAKQHFVRYYPSFMPHMINILRVRLILPLDPVSLSAPISVIPARLCFFFSPFSLHLSHHIFFC